MVGSFFGVARQRRTGGGEFFRGGEAARGSASGGWRLRGVRVEDELQALPKLSQMKCLSATIAFIFDSNI